MISCFSLVKWRLFVVFVFLLLLPVYGEQAVVRKHNKPRPRVAHRGIARFLGIDQNQVIPWSLHTPSLKISCKSVQPFSRNLAKKETNKDTEIQRNFPKETNNTRPPLYRELGNKEISEICRMPEGEF